MRQFYPVICLPLFYKTIAKPIVTNRLRLYNATAKTDLDPNKKAQQQWIRAIFSKKQTHLLQSVYHKHKNLSKVEMYVVELIREMIRQMRDKSPSIFVIGNFIPRDIITRIIQRGLINLTYIWTKFKRLSLENSIVGTCNCLRMLDLIFKI